MLFSSSVSNFRFPTVFLSHGTPMQAFGEDAYQEMLFRFANSLPRPRAILFLSAHSVSADSVHVLKTEENKIQHDFMGFPEDLYKINYNCPGSPEVAEEVAKLFSEAEFKTHFDQNAPLDHGIWIPMLHLYPKGDVPLVRVSLPLNLQPAQILKMGHAIAKLRENGVLVIASGGAVHNLRSLKWHQKNSDGESWAKQFEDFLIAALGHKDVEALLGAEEHPFFLKAHPSMEHFLPLLFTVGAALPNDQVNVLHRGIEYGSLSMLCFSLNHEQNQSLH